MNILNSFRSSLSVFLTVIILFSFFACKAKGITDMTEEAEAAGYLPDMQRLKTHYAEIISVIDVTELDTAILIDGYDNKLFLVHSNDNDLKIIAEYDISASKYGYGYERGSNQTPWGVHRIAGKYGEGQPSGMSFYDRRPTGKIAEIYTDSTDVDEDPVTSRIFWLQGLQDINRTSYWRFIYIHGTHEEGLIGTPQSKGCIRMKNDDVIALFDQVPTGTYVNIIRPLPENESLTEEE
jgi:hypothetical protein